MRIFLAPMEGVVDHNIRRLYAAIGGVDMAVTEFMRVSINHLPDRVFHQLCPELTSPLTIPVRLQLLGSDPELLAAHAARAAKLGAVGIDLNFGCPAKTVNKSRGGACLLQEPELLYDIAKAVRAAAPQAITVTAKMRLGFFARSGYVENATALAEGGINELFVHGRSKADSYTPPAYWAPIGEIREAINIPVIANGEIWTVDDALKCRDESGCTDLMLGRGLLATPDLARAIKSRLNNCVYEPWPWPRVLATVWQYHLATLTSYDLRYAGNRLKQWLMYLQRSYSGAGDFFEMIKRERTPEGLDAKLHEYCALAHITPASLEYYAAAPEAQSPLQTARCDN